MVFIAATGRRGQTITQPPPPGGGEVYGPLQGRQWVVDNAKPLAVTDPGGGITFTSETDLQNKINNNPAGSKFVRAAGGTEAWGSTVACGSKAPKIYFLGLAGSTSLVINGGGASIIGITGNQTGAPVEVHGGRWTNFGSSSGQQFHSPMIMRDGWLLEDFVTDGNFNAGFENQGSNVIIRRGRSSANGQNAWRTNEYVADGPKRTNNLYELIETFGNNTRGLNPGDFAGGVKLAQSANSIGRHIYCHNEPGFGLWFDTAEGGTLHPGNGFEECVVEDCDRSGLFLEGVGSGAFLRRNYVKNCGRNVTIGGQTPAYNNCVAIRISASDQSLGGSTRGDVSLNDIDYTLAQDGNIGGLILLFNHDGHPDRTKNWDIRQNRFWLRSASFQSNGRITGIDNATTGTMLVNGDVEFIDNEYHVISTSVNYWQWFTAGTRTETTMSYSAWQGFHPADDIPRVQI